MLVVCYALKHNIRTFDYRALGRQPNKLGGMNTPHKWFRSYIHNISITEL